MTQSVPKGPPVLFAAPNAMGRLGMDEPLGFCSLGGAWSGSERGVGIGMGMERRVPDVGWPLGAAGMPRSHGKGKKRKPTD